MIPIKEAIAKALETGISKYALAKKLGKQPIMIDNYLKDKVKSPQKDICQKIYTEYGLEVFPYTKEDLNE